MLRKVELKKKPIDSYEPVIGAEALSRIRDLARPLRDARVLHVNSTGEGGGEGSCRCFSNLQAGDAVCLCPGCGLGWHNGPGIVDGIDPDDVKWNITHEHPAGGHQHRR